jgi:hypothetical protein
MLRILLLFNFVLNFPYINNYSVRLKKKHINFINNYDFKEPVVSPSRYYIYDKRESKFFVDVKGKFYYRESQRL